MIDIEFSDDFDMVFGPGRDVAFLTGRDLAEQRLRVAVTMLFQDLIGIVGPEKIRQRVELQAGRVVSELDFVDDITDILVEPVEDEVNTLRVGLFYDTGDSFEFTI